MISVIVPVYNAEKLLIDCIESIRKQSYENIEVIMVNDGSTDDSGKICENYKKLDERIKVINQKNKGVSKARNVGIETARGEYVAFVDADDVIQKEYLEKLYKYANVGGLSVCKWSSVKDSFTYKGKVKELTLNEAQVSVFSHEGMEGYPFCKLFDLDLIKKNKIEFAEDIAICEDILFVIEYLSKSTGKIFFSDEKLYYYNINPYGALQSRFSATFPFDIRMLTEIVALERCEKYLIKDKKVVKSYELRKTKAAVTTLRTMYAKEFYNREMNQKLKRQICKNVLPYLVGDVGAISSKISVMLSFLNPRIEYWVWKWSKGNLTEKNRSCNVVN